MQHLYAWLSGPGLVGSVLFFGVGMFLRAALYAAGLGWRRDQLAYGSCSKPVFKVAARSVWTWLICCTRSAREHRFLALATVIFHAGFTLLMLFGPGHAELRREHIGLGLGLPATLTGVLSLLTLTALAALLLRRVLSGALRFLTSWRDWLLLGLCALILISGLLARSASGGGFQATLPDVSLWLLIHMFSAELLLVLAPFLFAHMVFFFVLRLQLALDYAVKRGGRKRGLEFPW